MVAGAPGRAWGLDKQGAAHGGQVEGDEAGGFDIEGSVTMGVSLANATYAARPDNTGLALMRYAAHVDVDLLGPTLSVPLDLNLFTDRHRQGAGKLAPSELDVISGLTSTWRAGPGSIELGSRVEHDRPVGSTSVVLPDGTSGRSTFTQTYADARARYLYSLARAAPGLAAALGEGDVSGAATLGWFAYNPSYAARPDNTGLALFRYGARVELSLWHDYLSFGLDGTLFTDRRSRPLAPSELDLTPEVIVHVAPFEVHLAYERDMPLNEPPGLPLDQPRLVQSFVYLLGVWSFDLVHEPIKPLESRGQVVSP
jgi:hypothetical protein